MRTMILLTTFLLLAACAGVDTVEPVPDTEIGLSRESVFDTPEPDPVEPVATDPGEGVLPIRPFDGAPPVIPHAASDFLPITLDENMCLDCHGVEEAEEGGPTPVPRSHHIDLRHAPDEVGEEIAKARYNCTACHATQTNAPPLVANEFTSGSGR